MPQKPSATHTIGLELDASKLKGAQLSLKQGKPTLDRLYEIQIEVEAPLTNEESYNPLDESEEGRLLQANAQKQLVVTSLATQDVLIRSLDVKLKKERDIDAILSFQTEPILPYPIEQALIDRMIATQTSEGTSLTVLAVRKDHLQNHLEKWNSLHIEPEMVSCVPAVLAAFSRFFRPLEAPYFIVYLSYGQISCILVKDDRLLAAQALSVGLESLRQIWLEECKENPKTSESSQNSQVSPKIQFTDIDFTAIDAERFPKLSQVLLNMRQEIMRVLYALSKQIKGREVTSLLFTGEGVKLKHLMLALNQGLNKELVEPISSPQFPLEPLELQRQALCLGAALSALPKSVDVINFRQAEFAYPHPWKRYQMAMLTFVLLSVLFSFALYMLGEVYLSNQEDDVRKEYVELLHTMHKPYAAFETEYRRKFPSGNEGEEGSVLPIEKMTQDEISNRLDYLELGFKASPDSFPLQPNTPRVSDVLAWLNTHPNVVGQEESSEALLPLLQIDSFSYTLVKRPELKKKQEHYQVKVEIEFGSLTPKHAREFHDALIAPNDFVDPKGEVKWSTNRGKYRTSFFLKDRTAYPSSTL